MRWLSSFLLCTTLAVTHLEAQSAPPAETRQGVVDAFALADRVGEEVWPGWSVAPTQLLLVGDSLEYFLSAPRSAKVDWTRRRIFSPTFQATFPAVGGVPTIVIGTVAGTGTPRDRWPLVVLHEHFHQLQYSRPDYYTGLNALGLARGDTTGMWALNFPFPYDSSAVQGAVRSWAAAMRMALIAAPRDRGALVAKSDEAKRAVDALLTADERRYLDFQLWQEGVPRWIELAVARAGRRAGLVTAETLAWQEQRLVTALDRIDLGAQRREVVYPLGAAWAELMERQGVNWKERYFEKMFELGR
jgi:hypothetical protein